MRIALNYNKANFSKKILKRKFLIFFYIIINEFNK